MGRVTASSPHLRRVRSGVATRGAFAEHRRHPSRWRRELVSHLIWFGKNRYAQLSSMVSNKMQEKRKAKKKLSKEQEALLQELYERFATTGEWPRYRDLERALGFSLAKVVKPVRQDLVTFYTPIGADTTCSLTLRGLESQPAAIDDLAKALGAIRFIAGKAATDGLSARISIQELQSDAALSDPEASRLSRILSNSLDIHNAIGSISMQSDGSRAEFRVSEHSPDFVAVDTVDAYEAVNRTIAQKREEEADLNKPVWSPATSRRTPQPVTLALRPTHETTYHRQVEAASRQLLSDRHFSEAVRAALQRFEAEVQRRSGLSKATGTDLMAKAFGDKKPALKVKNADVPGSREQDGYRFIAMGAMLALRNKYSHGRRVRLSEKEAGEQLGIVSYLFRVLDRATKAD